MLVVFLLFVAYIFGVLRGHCVVQAFHYYYRTVVCTGSVTRGYKQDNWRNESVVVYSPDSKDVSTEAEEPLFLRSVTRKRLLEEG
jgi:hypothetical protein